MVNDNTAKTIFSLARYNNGKFKSDKQADFILRALEAIKQAEVERIKSTGTGEEELQRLGTHFASYASNYGAVVDYYAKWDNEGITQITSVAAKSHKKKVIFNKKEEATYQKQKADSNSQWRDTYTKYIEAVKPFIQQLEAKIKQLEQQKQALLDKGMDKEAARVDRMIKDEQNEMRNSLRDIAEWEAQLEKLK